MRYFGPNGNETKNFFAHISYNMEIFAPPPSRYYTTSHPLHPDSTRISAAALGVDQARRHIRDTHREILERERGMKIDDSMPADWWYEIKNEKGTVTGYKRCRDIVIDLNPEQSTFDTDASACGRCVFH